MNYIIIIDDDELNVYLNSILLKETWKEVEILSFPSVERALEFFLDRTFLTPDLILLDINLPGLDAWDFLEQLSAHGKHVSDLPLVLLSSHISPSDREKIRDYDLDRAVLTKPLKMEALMELLVQ